MIPKIEASKWNHGEPGKGKIIATATVNHEIEFDVNDIFNLIGGDSEAIAKIINCLGEKAHQMDMSLAAYSFTSKGRAFITDMEFFITENT